LRLTCEGILPGYGVPEADEAELAGDTEEALRKHDAGWVRVAGADEVPTLATGCPPYFVGAALRRFIVQAERVI
jgi:hypothetical protein